MKYSLRQLEVFLAIAHHDNITKAANSLSMSQSAASSALKDLEDQFDIQLFDRVGKRLQINELGRLMRPRAEALLDQARGLESELMQHQTPGQLKLGATLTIGNYLAVELMAAYMAEHPSQRVTLEVANTSAIIEKLTNYELDIGLIEGEANNSNLEFIPWLEDELVVFCSPSHPLAMKSVISDQDLQEASWILREQGSGTRQAFDWAMRGFLPRFTILLELQHTEAIKRSVKAGLGISCLSRIALEESFANGSLVELNVAHINLHRQFYLVIHKQKYRSAGIERWLAMCTNPDQFQV
ncbi:LysR family transcriptional regulator [Neptunomonas sp.]|uniref:LysR family transcriptional regulator n=1 Tax=Neptunomonas TaxID=75687 RepID=UPI0035178AD5